MRAELQELVVSVLGELDDDDRRWLGGLRYIAKPRPDYLDLARGCIATQQACYWGTCRQWHRDPESTQLPDETPPEGEVILFLDNLRPLTRDRLRVAIRHELAHALGWTEDEIQAAGWTLPGGCC